MVEVVDGVSFREVEGQILLMLPDDDELYTLNDVGKLVWSGLVDGRSPEEIARLLADTYHIDEAQAQHDVGMFLDALMQRGFIRKVAS